MKSMSKCKFINTSIVLCFISSHWYQRAEGLRVRQEVKVASKNVKTELDEEIKTDFNSNDVKFEGDGDDDDADLLDLFDWRFKSS